MERRFRKSNQALADRIRTLRLDIGEEFGLLTRVVAALAGPIVLWTLRRETKRLARGKTYEPPTVIERRNWVEAES
jgi:hypothetical protein